MKYNSTDVRRRTNVSELFKLNEKAVEEARQYPRVRYLYDEIQSEVGKHIIGVVGPREVGKTVLLKQLAIAQPASFYLSADTLGESGLSQAAEILAFSVKKWSYFV